MASKPQQPSDVDKAAENNKATWNRIMALNKYKTERQETTSETTREEDSVKRYRDAMARSEKEIRGIIVSVLAAFPDVIVRTWVTSTHPDKIPSEVQTQLRIVVVVKNEADVATLCSRIAERGIKVVLSSVEQNERGGGGQDQGNKEREEEEEELDAQSKRFKHAAQHEEEEISSSTSDSSSSKAGFEVSVVRDAEETLWWSHQPPQREKPGTSQDGGEWWRFFGCESRAEFEDRNARQRLLNERNMEQARQEYGNDLRFL